MNKIRDSKNPKEHQKTLEDKKQYKKTIKDKKNFFCKALSSKNFKTVWSSIDRILNKQQKRINHEPSEMNNYLQRILLTNKILKVTLITPK